MSRFSFALLVVVGVILSTTVAQNPTQCPEGQVFNSCGSACPPSCNQDPARACTLQCVPGCECNPGLLFNAGGECVSPSQC